MYIYIYIYRERERETEREQRERYIYIYIYIYEALPAPALDRVARNSKFAASRLNALMSEAKQAAHKHCPQCTILHHTASACKCQVSSYLTVPKRGIRKGGSDHTIT